MAEWMAFRRLNPWGEARADLRTAMVCREMHRTGFAGMKKPKLSHFLLDFEAERPTLEQRAMQFQAWAASANSPQ